MAEITPQTIDNIKELVSDMLMRMGVMGRINARLSEYKNNEIVAINISTDDANIMIGQGGEHLVAFQHMARLLFRSQCKDEDYCPFIIDVNNYKKDKEEKLQSIARSAALKVRRTKEKEILRPMASYDRWVIHNFLSGEEDLATESSGEEPDRCVVIRLVK